MTDHGPRDAPFVGLALLANLGAGSAALSGCVMPSANLKPAAGERLPLEGCNAQAAQKLVGAAASAATGREAQRLAGAEMVRWIRPGDPVSADFNSGRLNVETDGRQIVRITCG